MRRGEQVELTRFADHVHFQAIAHPGLFQVLSEYTVDQADGWKVLDAAESHFFKLFQEMGHQPEWVCSAHPCKYRRIPDDGQYLTSHFDDYCIGVAVRQHPSQRSASSHTIAPRIINDDQIDTANLITFSRQSVTGSSTYNDFAFLDGGL